MAKLLASEASWQAANACLDTHGGFGFAAEYDVERKFRETRLYSVAPGLEQPGPRLSRPARARDAALLLRWGLRASPSSVMTKGQASRLPSDVVIIRMSHLAERRLRDYTFGTTPK